jgi:hypothetical protein
VRGDYYVRREYARENRLKGSGFFVGGFKPQKNAEREVLYMEYTLEQWKEEGKRRFGADIENWKFVCPKCGRVSTGKEFKDAGAEPSDMYQTCIGRHKGKLAPGGCDWAAFGLFGTLGKGDVVVLPDGKEKDVFAFAENNEGDLM